MMFIHVSELAIDRLLAGEITEADADAMRDHAASCDRCGALYDDALAVQRTFAATRPPLKLPAPMVKRRTAVAAVAASAALAAGLVGVLAWPRATRQPEARDELVRTKGSAIVGFYVSRHGDIRRGAVHELVAPGDRIELVTSTTEPVWFAAISIDERQTRSVYAPVQRIAAGQDRALGASVELDDVLGTETVTGIFCSNEFEPLAIDPAAPPATCTVDHFTLDKRPR